MLITNKFFSEIINFYVTKQLALNSNLFEILKFMLHVINLNVLKNSNDFLIHLKPLLEFFIMRKGNYIDLFINIEKHSINARDKDILHFYNILKNNNDE